MGAIYTYINKIDDCLFMYHVGVDGCHIYSHKLNECSMYHLGMDGCHIYFHKLDDCLFMYHVGMDGCHINSHK